MGLKESGETMKKLNKVFVYGTLKDGHRNGEFYKRHFQRTVEEATVPGAMYNLGSFPGVRLDEEGTIHGEIHTFSPDDMDEVLKAMDRLEGYSERRGEDNFYNRRIVEARLTSGEHVEVYMYEFGKKVSPDRLIKDGNWR